MPTLCRFYGLVIRMYHKKKEHNPPHIHVIYGEDYASIRIADGVVLEGELPPKALSLTLEWVMLHKKELLHIWNTQEFREIEPLK